MAFTTRSHRPMRTNEPTSTPADLGPGAYPVKGSIHRADHGFAPFASTTERSRVAQPNYNPSPGDYEPLKGHGWGKGSAPAAAQFRSGVSRLHNIELASASVPGPGLYDTRPPWIKESAHVPSEKQTKEGKLVPQKPKIEILMDGPGPGKYDPNYHVSKPHKASDFTKSEPRSQIFTGATDVPGPGAYDAEAVSAPRAPPPPKFAAPFGSRVPLQCNKPVYEDELDAPGPGSYNTIASISARRHTALQTGFTTAVHRMDILQLSSVPMDVPGPGAYDPASAGAGGGRRFAPAAAAPFTSTASRFATAPAGGAGAPTQIGPGEYAGANRSFSEEVMRRRAGRGVFGSTSDRFGGAIPPPPPPAGGVLTLEPYVAPGPGAYDVDQRGGASLARLTRKESSAFASATGRFDVTASAQFAASLPPPGAYEAPDEWDRDRKRGWRPAKEVFMSQDRRFKGRVPRDQVMGPGPGSYDPRAGAGSPPRGALLSTTAHRFDGMGAKQNFVPGPGAYSLRAELGKPSFNVTVDQ